MYNVSDDYLEKINSYSKQVYWYGTATLTNGTVYEFDASNLAQGQTSISKELCNANAIRMGGACSSELKISFMLDYDGDYYTLNGLIVDRNEFYNAEITLTFRLYLDDGFEDVELGTFIVADTERKQMVLTCTAYDYMQKFNKECVSSVQSLPYNVLLSACSICGVELGSTVEDLSRMVNGKETIAMYDPKNQISTWRDVIGYVASMLCANAVIKADKKLYLIPFSNGSVRVIDSGKRVSLSLEDYVNNYQSITATNLRINIEDKITISENGLTYPLGANPLIQYVTTTERKTVLNNIIQELSRYTYTPFSGEFFCDPSFELGDVVTFTDNHAYDSTTAIITKIEISLSGHMKLGCEGENPNTTKVISSSNPETAQESSGAIGDGVTFYDYVDHNEVVIDDTEQIVSISYESSGQYRQEFAAELEIEVETNESYANSTYAESGECEIAITYFINGVEIGNCHPQTSFMDGKHLLHLMYFWDADMRIETSTFEAVITVSGGTVTINNNHSRIMQSGTAYAEVSNILAYIDVEREPTYPFYWINQAISYSGVKIVGEYEDGTKVDITNDCVFTPANGSVVTTPRFVNVDVLYVTEDERQLHTAFAMEEIYPEELVITPPTNVEYYSGRGDHLDYTGLNVKLKFTDGTKIDVTNDCTLNPQNGALVTKNTPQICTVSYMYESTLIKDFFDLDIQPYEPEELQITPPTKTVYYADIGETLDYTGLVVKCKYTDGSIVDVTNSCTKEPAENTEVVLSTPSLVKVSYTDKGKTVKDSFDIDIEVYEVTKLEVTHLPNKLSYKVGENLNYAGLVVTAYFSNNTHSVVTNQCSITPANGTTVTSRTSTGVDIRYSTEMADFEIEVITVDDIKVTAPELSYEVGDTMDFSEVTVARIWSDESTDDITSQCTFNPADGSEASTSSTYVDVLYSYGGQLYQDGFEIDVYEFLGIDITKEPDSVSYWHGDGTDYTGIVVTGSYSNGETEDVTDQCTFEPANGYVYDSIGEHTVSVYYTREKTGRTYRVQFVIEIKAPEPVLKYLSYTTDTANRIIYVTGLNAEEIAGDNLRNLVLPSTYTDATSGITFRVVLGPKP